MNHVILPPNQQKVLDEWALISILEKLGGIIEVEAENIHGNCMIAYNLSDDKKRMIISAMYQNETIN